MAYRPSGDYTSQIKYNQALHSPLMFSTDMLNTYLAQSESAGVTPPPGTIANLWGAEANAKNALAKGMWSDTRQFLQRNKEWEDQMALNWERFNWEKQNAEKNRSAAKTGNIVRTVAGVGGMAAGFALGGPWGGMAGYQMGNMMGGAAGGGGMFGMQDSSGNYFQPDPYLNRFQVSDDLYAMNTPYDFQSKGSPIDFNWNYRTPGFGGGDWQQYFSGTGKSSYF